LSKILGYQLTVDAICRGDSCFDVILEGGYELCDNATNGGGGVNLA